MQIFLPRTIRHLSLKALLFLPPLHFCLPRPRNGRSPGTCHPLSHRCQPHHPPHRASRCWCETDPDFRPPKTSFLLSACQKYSFYIYVNKWFSKVFTFEKSSFCVCFFWEPAWVAVQMKPFSWDLSWPTRQMSLHLYKKWNHLLSPALNRIYSEWEAKVENSIWQCYQTRIKIQQRKHFRLMG